MCPRTLRGILRVTAIFVALASPVFADLTHDNEGWFQITATGPLAGRLRVFLEAQPRIGENLDTGHVDMRSMVARGAFGWALTPRWSLWAGYGFVPTFNPERDEHRVFQQSTYDATLGPFHMQHRTRLEERFLQHTDQMSWRLRHQVRLVYPLPRAPAWALTLSDEFFFDLNTIGNGPVAGFDQNRVLAGVSHQLTPHLRVEVAYVNQVLNGRRGDDDTLRHNGLSTLAITW